ncbi:MAG TPA: antibiotic biosynthesis monooxygenase [Candidatus Paceibacterota bacterium]|nr:antibiotic biosynthesis monooxygenase [Candidatus Paceibacterota bacterium]
MYAVIFTSIRTLEEQDLYSEWSEKMEALVKDIDGYVRHIGFRDAESRKGVTISYFESAEAIARWKQLNEHLEAQRLGREHFYEEYQVQVSKIEREYSWNRA